MLNQPLADSKHFLKHYFSRDTHLPLTLSAGAVIEVTVDADLRRHFRFGRAAYSERPLVAGAAALALLAERVAVQLGQLLAWHSRQAVDAVCVLADDVLDDAELHQFTHGLVGVRRTQRLPVQLVLVTFCTGSTCGQKKPQ